VALGHQCARRLPRGGDGVLDNRQKTRPDSLHDLGPGGVPQGQRGLAGRDDVIKRDDDAGWQVERLLLQEVPHDPLERRPVGKTDP